MKLKKLAWILGLTAALSVTAACKGDSMDETQNAPAAAEEGADQEAASEEDAAQSQEAIEEDVAQSQEAAEEDADAEDALSGTPIRIYGTIEEVGEDSLTVDNQSEASSQGEMIFQIDPESTVLVDAQSGLPVGLADVQTGSFEAYLNGPMTMSLPPQTTPEAVIVNIPADFEAPQYAVAAKDLTEEEAYYTLEATDGRTWVIPKEVQIQPFRTRNIVTVEDIKEGSRCLIWTDEQGEAAKVVLLEG